VERQPVPIAEVINDHQVPLLLPDFSHTWNSWLSKPEETRNFSSVAPITAIFVLVAALRRYSETVPFLSGVAEFINAAAYGQTSASCMAEYV
jgi:hypothetical protein